jgi:hypothetical protein
MPSVELSCRVGRVVGYPPLSDMVERQPREFPEALLEAGTFEDRPLRPPRRKTTGDDRGRAIAQPMRD